MKKISAEIIADSKNEHGDRITTFVLTFPRFILAELNTHRMLSRNSASSRAIPFKKMVEMVKEDPFIPIAWQKDHKGMQGTEYLDEIESHQAKNNWLYARDKAIEGAKSLNSLGATKQLCNRLLEPFMWHTAIVTATEFENFFKLRCPQYRSHAGSLYRSKADFIQGELTENERDGFLGYSDHIWLEMNKGQSEIHIMELAEQMWDTMNESTPKQLKEGEWHIPFGDKFDTIRLDELRRELLKTGQENDSIECMNRLVKKIATARCARVSYLNFEGKDDYEADIRLHDILAKEGHWSPFEHCAQAMDESIQSGNFKGFKQYRKEFNNESGTK